MCIVIDNCRVAKTKILAMLSKDRQRQLIVYSNEVQTNIKNNVMILPVPNKDGNSDKSIKFVDLSSYPNIFDDCRSSFASPMFLSTNSVSFSLSRSIAIVDVGSYQASIVPSIDEFVFLNSLFKIPENVIEILKKYYAKNFSFIVCKLREGEVKYHPFAYYHELLRHNTLFIPTRHHHPHSIGGTHVEEAISDWDHAFYAANVTNDSERPFTSCRIDMKKLPSFFNYPIDSMSEWSRTGLKKNEDVMVECV